MKESPRSGPRIPRRSLFLTGAAIALVGPKKLVSTAVAQSPAGQLRQVRLLLDFVPGGWHAPFYVARDLGWYREEGLDVEIVPGTGSSNTIRVVGAGGATFGMSDSGTMSAGVAQDVPVMAIGMFNQKCPITVFSFPAKHIEKPKDLEGKTVGAVAGAAEAKIFPAFARKNGVDLSKVKMVDLSIATRIAALVSGNIDAFVGYVISERDVLAASDSKVVNQIKFADHGIVMYGNGMIVNNAFANDNPAVVERFTRVTMRGLKLALDDPDKALESTYKAIPDREQNLIKDQWRLSAPLMESDATRQYGLGWMTDAAWSSTQDLMVQYGGQSKTMPLEKLYTDKFLKNSRT